MTIQTVLIDELTLGSYVTGVANQTGDVVIKHAGWVRSEQLIATLKQKGVLAVFVDVDKQLPPPKQLPVAAAEISGPPTYNPRVEFELERSRAELTLQSTRHTTALTMQQLAQADSADLSLPAQHCDKLIDSSKANPQALLYLQQVLQDDDALLRHAIRCACLMAAFCQALQLSAETARDYTLAALLHDTGKAQLKQLFPEEVATDLAALPYSVALLRQSDCPPLALDAVAGHLAPLSEQSTGAQLLAIVNRYANLQELADHGKLTSSSFNSLMVKAAGQALDLALTQQFLNTIGLYPPGTAVRLKSGKLALVLENHQKFADKPKVKLFYHAVHHHHLPAKVLDLAKLPEESIVSAADLTQFALDLRQYL
jgi:hypothetical protein